MANKRNFSNVFFYTSLLLLSWSLRYSEGAFLSHQTITNGLSLPNQPNYPFYYNNLLHLIVGVKGGSTGEVQASLVQYNSGGTVARNISFPLPCLSKENCESIEGALFGLVNNTAYINLRISESPNYYYCMIYQVDLDSFKITNSSDALNNYYYYCSSYSLPNWTPYNSTSAISEYSWFDYETLSFVGDAPINPVNNIGGSSTALSDQNLIFYQDQDGYNQLFVSANVETGHFESLYLDPGMMMVFLGDNSTYVAITTSYYEIGGYNITLIDASNIPRTYVMNELISNTSPQTGMFADTFNNVFYIGNTASSDEKGIIINQYQVDVINNSIKQLDKITLVDYFSPQFYPPYFSVLSWGLNSPTQQFAIVGKDLNSQSSVLLVVDYDNSPSPYY